jgi:hypothetical protein
MKKLKAADGAAVSRENMKDLKLYKKVPQHKEDVLKKLNENSLKELKGSAVSENEMKRFKNSIPKKAKGGMSKKQLDIAEAVAENSLLPGGTLIQLRQAAKAVKKSKGGFIIGKGADYIKDLL